jgi:hypothetical protein
MKLDLMEAFQVIMQDHLILALSDTRLVALPLVANAPDLVVFEFEDGLPKLVPIEQPQLRGRFKADLACLKQLAEGLIPKKEPVDVSSSVLM